MVSDELEAREIAAEQTYVDEVYVHLEASARNAQALAKGLPRMERHRRAGCLQRCRHRLGDQQVRGGHPDEPLLHRVLPVPAVLRPCHSPTCLRGLASAPPSSSGPYGGPCRGGRPPNWGGTRLHGR